MLNMNINSALITGSGRGMGRAIALRLAQEHIPVIINDLDKRLGEETQKIIQDSGGICSLKIGDASDEDFVDDMVENSVSEYGSVDILVNNAGVLRPTPIVDITLAEWEFVIKGNLTSTFLCTKKVIPAMKKNNWGRIINFSSTAGKNISTVGGAHYTAAKAAILGLTRHTAKEVARFGITVNALCPGLINTEMVRATISDESVDQYANSFPIQRLGEPEEVAELVMFLASEKASYITGASLDINRRDLMI